VDFDARSINVDTFATTHLGLLWPWPLTSRIQPGHQ